jgi:hypothetical protein
LHVVDCDANGSLVERHYPPRAVKHGDIVSTGYPDADGLSNGAQRWICSALAANPFIASAVAIDQLLAHPDPDGPHLVSWQEMDAYQRSPAFQNSNFLIDFIILANGGRFPVYRRDCKAVPGTTPSICPSAEPKPPVRLRPPGEMLAGLEKRFRELRLVADGETIHWVGRQSTVESTCVCHLSHQAKENERTCHRTLLDFQKVRLHVDDVDSFARVRLVQPSAVMQFLTEGHIDLSEDLVKRAIEDILAIPFHNKDRPNELDDIYTTNVVVDGTRRPTAFLLKGPGIKKKEMNIADCGKNGDQLVRLFDAPADLFVIQFVGRVAEMVVKDVEGKIAAHHKRGAMAQFIIVDGQDTARLLHAYGKLPNL